MGCFLVALGNLFAGKLTEAANKLSEQPNAIMLRYLQTLTEIAGEKNSTIIFPLPMELINGLLEKNHQGKNTKNH